MRAGVAVVVAAALAPAFATHARAGSRASCFPAGAHTLAQSGSARIYYVGDDIEFPVACLFRTGRRTRLSRGDLEAIGAFATRGRYAAYNSRSCGEGTEGCYYEMVVVDLVSRRVKLRTLNTLDPPFCVEAVGQGDDCGESGVGRVVVTARGSVAWITCDGLADECERHPSFPAEVYLADTRGKRRLDSGRSIRARTLRLSPRKRSVSWVKKGRRHSARIH
jgi:hypothetical protein